MSDTRSLITGPFNRVEGDLEITLDLKDNVVKNARINAPLFRGFEKILEGKSPLDALTLVPRICGICSVSQSVAAAKALAGAQNITPPPNAQRHMALIHAVENVADHMMHFHMFFMADFARDIYAAKPWFAHIRDLFKAQSGTAMRDALGARNLLLNCMGLLAGKWPHSLCLQPGGVTKAVQGRDKIKVLSLLRQFQDWLEARFFGGPLEEFLGIDSLQALETWRQKAPYWAYGRLFLDIADDLGLIQMGLGPQTLMSFGGYEIEDRLIFAPGVSKPSGLSLLNTADITEDLSHAWMLGATKHPFEGVTNPDSEMQAGYSWCKAPRLASEVVEVGAIARQVIDKNPLALALLVDHRANVLGRVVARMIEMARLSHLMQLWINDIDPKGPFMCQGQFDPDARAEGLTEAARGSLGHWLRLEDGKIATYQIIAPTTWNFSPQDVTGLGGACEQALAGATAFEGEITPVNVQHIVRSFDPCMVCTVH